MKKTAKKVARRSVARPLTKKGSSRKVATKKPAAGVVKLLEVVRATQTRKRQKAA